MIVRRFALGLVLTCLMPVSWALAQADGLGLSSAQTHRVVSILEKGQKACDSTEPVFRVDCYYQVYRDAARMIQNNAAYWEAEIALKKVSSDLYTFTRANVDRSRGKVRVDGRRVKAVQAAAVPQAEALFVKSTSEAEALLRGKPPAEDKYLGPIADAIKAHDHL